MVKKIQPTRGLFAKIDDADFERVNSHSWYAHIQSNKKDGSGCNYAASRINKKIVLLHRFILGGIPV
jgi:hypothetical protein